MGAGARRPGVGPHRRKRPRRALPGMMLHQDGSSHEWVPGRWWNLIVTLDDATSDIYSAFFVAEEGTISSFQGMSEAIRAKGLFCSLYADRASHYWNTPETGGKVDKDTPTQVGRARSACSAPCRSACPRNSGSPASPTWPGPTASSRSSSCHNTTPASRPRPRTRAPPSSPSPARSTTSSASTRNAPSQTTTRCATSAWHFRSPPAATAAITSRPGSASTNTPTAQWPSSMDRDVWRDTTPMANRSTAKPARPRDPLRRDRPAPCGQVDSRAAPDHFPTGPATATEAVNSYGT